MKTKLVLVLMTSLLMSFLIICKDDDKKSGPGFIYRELIEQALEIDEGACEYAQTRFGDVSDDSGITVVAVDKGSQFSSSKASVDATTDTVTAVYTFEKSTPDNEVFGSAQINSIILCKTRTPESIEEISGVLYTSYTDAAASCSDINDYIYEKVKDLLSGDQITKFSEDGKPLNFIADHIVGTGRLWLPIDPKVDITDDGSQLNISSASLESDFDPLDAANNTKGVKYCKLISAQNMIVWMIDRSFRDNTSVMETDPNTALTCDSFVSEKGSCYFYMTQGSNYDYVCEDYIGTDYTGGPSGTSKEKCDSREYTDATGDVYQSYFADGQTCAERTDINKILNGICAVNDSADGAYAWSMYEPLDPYTCPRPVFYCK